ncbi:MAG: metallophosphoesterase family protein, partial [Armatimonadetes bacterium]|nr:metallophosphoesterase family protein [Armatimonadota bacterium]
VTAGALLLGGWAGPAATALAAGTVLKNEELCTVGSDHAVITWVTPEQNTDTSLWVGTDKHKLTKLTVERDKEFHWAEVKNLQPATPYWYQVESNGARGSLNSFKTLPAPEGKYLFSFALFSDTHISNGISEGDPNEIYFGKLTEHSRELLIQCIRDSRRRGIDLAVITGDLTDSSHLEQYRQLKEEILPEFNGTPYYICIGNHDKYEQKSRTGLGAQGFLEHIGNRESTYASVMYQDHQFILIDSCKKDNDWGTIDGEQMEWLRKTLRKGGDRPSYLFFHHTCNGADVWFGINNFLAFQNLINDFPGVQAVFNGHMHRNVVTTNWLMTRNRPYVELPATVQFPCGYGIVRVYEKGFEYNSYKVSRLDLAEKSRERVILKSLGSAVYTWYAFGGIGDRSIAYSSGALHRPVQYELAATLDTARAVDLYEKAQAYDGATLAPAAEAGKMKVILGRYDAQDQAVEEQRQKASRYGVQALVTELGNYDVPEHVKRHQE